MNNPMDLPEENRIFRLVSSRSSAFVVMSNPADAPYLAGKLFPDFLPTTLCVYLKSRGSEQSILALVLYVGEKPRLDQVLREYRNFNPNVDLAPRKTTKLILEQDKE